MNIDAEFPDEYLNEWVYVFWVLFDDAHAELKRKGLPLVQITENKVLSSIVKIIGADNAPIASELNQVNHELSLERSHRITLDDVVYSLALKMAIELKQNEDNLTSLDLSSVFGIQVGIVTVIILAIAAFFLGLAI